MARIDDLTARINDPALRREIESAIAEIKKRQRFGLVFEEHVPETSSISGLPIQIGSVVQRRTEPVSTTLYKVASVAPDGLATIQQMEDDKAEAHIVHTRDLLVVKRIGEPIFPSLTPLGAIQRGAAQKPHHAIINGENYHAVQLLALLFEGRVDCIYLDPPYNTGARDWKYNNRYVDDNDSWRHSKWLSFMQKRLRLAKKLLKPDGVLIVTIDEHEVHHLGMLLEKVFPEYLRYMITVVINPKGTGKANFARVDEQAFFVVPKIGRDVITGSLRLQDTLPLEEMVNEDEDDSDDEDDTQDQDETEAEVFEAEEHMADAEIEWEYQHARRRGSESSYRHQRPNQFYPIFIDEASHRVVRVGQAIPLETEPDFSPIDGLRPIWPIDAEGNHRCWRFIPGSMQKEIDAENAVLGRYNSERNTWTINIKRAKKTVKKLKTVWWERTHDAGTHGTELVRKVLGRPGLFPFPKSLYAVRDALAAVVRERPDALIVDFFAGSGTTFHATCLLNAEDGGQRRAILVTNNEVSEKTARHLNKAGHYVGNEEFEAYGIFEQVTRPRCEAVVTGHRPDGTPLRGTYTDGRRLSSGFSENVEFYRLDYLDPDDVDLGCRFNSLLSSLWIAAGGIGSREDIPDGAGFSIPPNSTYGVLFKEARFRQFKVALEGRPEVSHVWLVTDSEEAYAEMQAALPRSISVSMLYRDYLRYFRSNMERNI